MTPEVEYEMTPEDVVAFTDYATEHDQNGRPIPRTRAWAWVALAALVVLMFISLTGTDRWEFLLPDAPSSLGDALKTFTIPTLLMLGAAAYLFRRRFYRWLVLRSLREPQKARILGRHRLHLSPAGVTATTPVDSTTIGWQDVTRIASTKAHLFFMLGPHQAIIVPRRAFADTDALEDFLGTTRRSQSEHHVKS
jgi:hypothetical protein